jgi:ABC-type xylose transport system permease subunit
VDEELQKRWWWLFPIAMTGMAIAERLIGSGTNVWSDALDLPADQVALASMFVLAGIVAGLLARAGKLPRGAV